MFANRQEKIDEKSVEQRIENPCVGSSILPLATRQQPKHLLLLGLIFIIDIQI